MTPGTKFQIIRKSTGKVVKDGAIFVYSGLETAPAMTYSAGSAGLSCVTDSDGLVKVIEWIDAYIPNHPLPMSGTKKRLYQLFTRFFDFHIVS